MARILIIEADARLRQNLCESLIAANYEVATAPHGKAALLQMRYWKADLVITDMLIPEMDGVETINALRREHPGVRIIAVSGGGLSPAGTYLRLATALGAQRTLAKPFTRSEMLAVVQTVLLAA